MSRSIVPAAALALAGVLAACGSGSSAAPTASDPQRLESGGGEAPPDQARGRHRPIPKEAFDACRQKAVGDACSVTMREHEIKGSCAMPPAGSTEAGAVCKPEGGRKIHEAALAACDGKASGDACSVTTERGNVEGSCLAPRVNEGRLVCAPARSHRHDAKDGGT